MEAVVVSADDTESLSLCSLLFFPSSYPVMPVLPFWPRSSDRSIHVAYLHAVVMYRHGIQTAAAVADTGPLTGTPWRGPLGGDPLTG